MPPKFTIIIPAFNAARTIRSAVDSVLTQSFTDFEVWVIDGSSADDTGAILAQYEKSDARVHGLSEPDRGIYDGMNKGIAKATGEWIYFLGSDDGLYDNDVFKHIVESESNQPNADIIYGNVLLSKNIGFDHDSLIYAGKFKKHRLLQLNINHQSIFYRRSLFERFGLFNIKYKLKADWDFNLRCFNLVSSFYTERIIANFTVGASSAQSQDEAFVHDWIYNIVFTYPDYFRLKFFGKWKRALFSMFFRQFFSLRLKKAYRTANVIWYHLNPLGTPLTGL